MNIEWGVVITQAIGFLIVMGILKKYAWGTLMDFLDERRDKIAGEFAEIDRSRAEADKLKEEFNQKLEDIENTRRSKIQEGANEGTALANDIKEEARKEAHALREKTQQDIGIELDKANVALRDRMVDAVITSTEKVIRERLDTDKHKQLINQFLDEFSVKDGGQA